MSSKRCLRPRRLTVEFSQTFVFLRPRALRRTISRFRTRARQSYEIEDKESRGAGAGRREREVFTSRGAPLCFSTESYAPRDLAVNFQCSGRRPASVENWTGGQRISQRQNRNLLRGVIGGELEEEANGRVSDQLQWTDRFYPNRTGSTRLRGFR